MTMTATTLMMAIMATDSRLSQLKERLEVAADPELSWLEEDVQAYWKALSEMKALYVAMQAGTDNLPSYEEVIAMNRAEK